jgi:hypothetical protein
MTGADMTGVFVPNNDHVPKFVDMFRSHPAARQKHKEAVRALADEIVGPEPVAPASRSPLAQRRWRAEQKRWLELERRAERAERRFWFDIHEDDLDER